MIFPVPRSFSSKNTFPSSDESALLDLGYINPVTTHEEHTRQFVPQALKEGIYDSIEFCLGVQLHKPLLHSETEVSQQSGKIEDKSRQ
jgi:hypothetical protein